MKDLVSPIEGLTDEELHERLRLVRLNRNTLKPGAAQRKKAVTKRKIGTMDKLLLSLTPKERESLLKQLSDQA